MPPEKNLALPFLTRAMLNWEHGMELSLELESYSNITSQIDIIGATREGPFKFIKKHTGDGGQEKDEFRIPDFPIFVTVHSESTAVERGEFYGTLYLTANGTRILKLCAGYISTQSGISWPITQSESELAGHGKLKEVFPSNPSAGNEWTISVPNNERWLVKALFAELVTDATSITRHVHIIFDDDGVGEDFNMIAGDSQIASLTRKYTVGNFGSMPVVSNDDDILVPIIPDFMLKEDAIIKSETVNLQAGDNWGTPTIIVEQWFED